MMVNIAADVVVLEREYGQLVIREKTCRSNVFWYDF